MRHNGKPTWLISEINPLNVDLDAKRPTFVCPGCGRWRPITSPLKFHTVDGTEDGPRCPSVGQRIHNNLDPAAWHKEITRYRRDGIDPNLRRRPTGKPIPKPMFLGHDSQ